VPPRACGRDRRHFATVCSSASVRVEVLALRAA
jgi:hypothetical protein